MKLRFGVVGLGYWGPHYIRNLIRHVDTEAVWGCDLSDSLLSKVNNFYPQVKLTKDFRELLSDKSLHCIAIATPPETHFKLARAALESGKHVIVAKPLATKKTEAEKLIKIAKSKGLMLHCDLTYLYTGAVKTIKNLLTKDVLGQPLYYDSTRSNLGLVQNDVNVVWDLAPHDLSIIDYCFGFKPKKVFAVGSKHHGNSTAEEMGHITINYTNNFIAHIHVSWISPIKLRTILIGGTKKMIYYDDVEPDEKIKIYDKGIKFSPHSITPTKPLYRSGKVIIPKIDNEEALYLEFDQLVKQFKKKVINYQNADMSINMIRILEACDNSLKRNKPVSLI